MEIQDYLDLFTVDKQNKYCRVVTTEEIYEGVYLRSVCFDNGLAIIISPKGKTLDYLKNVSCHDNDQCELTKEVAIYVADIKEIDFD